MKYPYGTVLIDWDGETMMSLGYVFDAKGTRHLAAIQIAWGNKPGTMGLRPIVFSYIDRQTDGIGRRYAPQED